LTHFTLAHGHGIDQGKNVLKVRSVLAVQLYAAVFTN